MPGEAAERMFTGLPPVFRQRDASGDLARLLDALGSMFFAGIEDEGRRLPGLEQWLDDLPALFVPAAPGDVGSSVPDRFLPWLAEALAFTPYRLFPAAELRRILAGIVPLYGRRGTAAYLRRLIELCLGERLRHLEIDDRPGRGFVLRRAEVGVDTRFGSGRAFRFRVVIGLDPSTGTEDGDSLPRRLRALIDFSKPAFTRYELVFSP